MMCRNCLIAALCILGCWCAGARGDSAPSTQPTSRSAGPAGGADAPSEELASTHGPRRLALCIGINGYDPKGDYEPLAYAVADAKALGRAFRAVGFETVLMVDDADDPALRPTCDNLDRQIKLFARSARNEDDTLVISYCGHGDKVGSQTALIPIDYAQQRDVLTISRLFDRLNDPMCRARRKLMIIDACRSSNEDRGRRLANGFLQSLAVSETFVVISSCGENQSSYEDDKLKHGHFTAALIWGLAGRLFTDATVNAGAKPSGEAFAAGDEFLSVAQLYDFIARTFRDKQWADRQSPRMFGQLDARASLNLARRAVPKPPPLTDEDREELATILSKAQDAYRKGDYTQAVKRASTGLRIQEQNADCLAMRGLAYFDLGYRDEAEQDAARALAIDANQALALAVRGRCIIFKPGQTAEGFDPLSKALGLVQAEPQRWPLLVTGRAACVTWLNFGTSAARRDIKLAVDAYERVIAMKDAPADVLSRAIVGRGMTFARQGQLDKAIADYTRVIDMKEPPTEVRAVALWLRGAAFDEQDRRDEALADYNRLIALKEPPAELLAKTLLNRAIAFDAMGRVDDEIADYSRLIDSKETPDEFVAKGLLNRGVCWRRSRDFDKALADFTRLIDMKSAPADQVAMALINRGAISTVQGRPADEFADLSRVIAMKDAPPSQLTLALLTRSIALSTAGKPDEQIADLSRLIDLPDAPAGRVARALLLRGLAYGDQGRTEQEAADYTRMLALHAGSPDLVVPALWMRALANFRLRRFDETLGDCTRILDTPGASAERLAQARLRRGLVLDLAGRIELALADYDRLLSEQGAPPEIMAEAKTRRAADAERLARTQQEIADSTRIIESKTAAPEALAQALVQRSWRFYHSGKLDEALADARQAAKLFPKSIAMTQSVAVILLRQGKAAEAREVVEASLELGPPAAVTLMDLQELREMLNGAPETAVFLGWLEMKSGQDEKGRACLAEYLKQHPTGAWADLARQLGAARGGTGP